MPQPVGEQFGMGERISGVGVDRDRRSLAGREVVGVTGRKPVPGPLRGLGEDTLRLDLGDQLLLCTDGIWGTIEDHVLRDILLDAVDLETAVQTAIDLALAAGAPDNAAIVIARCIVMPAS